MAHVHQHDVRMQAARLLDRLGTGRRLADDLQLAAGLEHRLEARAHQRLVIDDQDARAAHRSPP